MSIINAPTTAACGVLNNAVARANAAITPAMPTAYLTAGTAFVASRRSCIALDSIDVTRWRLTNDAASESRKYAPYSRHTREALTSPLRRILSRVFSTMIELHSRAELEGREKI